MEDIKTSGKVDFGELVSSVREYGFIDDTDLADLFKIDMSDLEELIDYSEDVSDTKWLKYRSKLYNFLKREKAKYQTIYYNQDKTGS